MEVIKIKESFETIKAKFKQCKPCASFILGSGWKTCVSEAEVLVEIPYEEIPALGQTSVQGHHGTLSLCNLHGKQVVIFSGRRHVYEAVDNTSLCFPALLSKELDASLLVVTNAAGSLDPNMPPGSIMLIEDHINLLGTNPLIGATSELFPKLFTDMSQPYDRELTEIFQNAMQEKDIPSHKGIYAAVHGPSYETKAEIRMLQTLGAHAVGMSTVPSVIVARTLGLKVLGLSCITNFGTGLSESGLDHSEVLDVGEQVMPKMRLVFKDLMQFL